MGLPLEHRLWYLDWLFFFPLPPRYWALIWLTRYRSLLPSSLVHCLHFAIPRVYCCHLQPSHHSPSFHLILLWWLNDLGEYVSKLLASTIVCNKRVVANSMAQTELLHRFRYHHNRFYLPIFKLACISESRRLSSCSLRFSAVNISSSIFKRCTHLIA